jgi:transcriptional regulator with XRE-family HTH domain
LRRLVPDGELVRRRAAGETLRELAAGYGVSHTTLGRYFARPEIARQLKEAGRLVRRERQTAAARRAAERRLEGEVRRQAKEQVARERERRLGAARAMLGASRPGVRRRRRSAYEAWLDEHDARQPLTRADLRSRSDELAAHTVAAGGGVQVVIEATGLRTRENVLRLIDPVILVEALDNDAATAVAEPVRERLRRLVPDPELVRRRAAGVSLRRIAADYGVAHTTLYRYFQRPEVARQLRQAKQRPRAKKVA